MLTELQTRKLTRSFRVNDLNGDGVIERRDYQTYASNVAEQFGMIYDSRIYEALMQRMMSDWGQCVSALPEPTKKSR